MRSGALRDDRSSCVRRANQIFTGQRRARGEPHHDRRDRTGSQAQRFDQPKASNEERAERLGLA